LFTCFTRIKVQILSQKALQRTYLEIIYRFTCFTGTNVQILTQKALQRTYLEIVYRYAQSLQQQQQQQHIPAGILLSLLALLVQRYKY
jgi:hypothetical protein